MKTHVAHHFRFPLVLAVALAFGAANPGFAADPAVISSASLASLYNASGASVGGFGGGPNMNNLFNGRFGSDYVYLPNMNDYGGGWLMIDFTSKLATGYYITEIKIGSGGTNPYSLYWSANGTSWNNLADHEGGTSDTAGITLVYPVGQIATHVKLVFHNTPRWNYSTPQISEIQVWGIDPADMACTHPSWTDWVPSQEATCTTRAVEIRSCTQCSEEETREVGEPLGHDYESHLELEGKCNRFGRGFITCSRCDFRADFPEPGYLLASSLGGVAAQYKVQFTNLRVSSENHPAWGTGVANLYDGRWTDGYWANVGLQNAWIDFEFGTEIDLTSIEFSVLNHAQTLKFFRREGEEEELLTEVTVVPDETEGAPDTQRMTVDFVATPLTAVRIRIDDSTGVEVWSANSVTVREIRAYGTVKGAGLLRYDKTTLIQIR